MEECELTGTMGGVLGRRALQEMEGPVRKVIGDGRVGLGTPMRGGLALQVL